MTSAKILSPDNRYESTYGFLRDGIDIDLFEWNASSPGVKEQLQHWCSTLAMNFPGTEEVRIADLAQLASNLDDCGETFVAMAAGLVEDGRFTESDATLVTSVGQGLQSAAASLRTLYKVMKDQAPTRRCLISTLPHTGF